MHELRAEQVDVCLMVALLAAPFSSTYNPEQRSRASCTRRAPRSGTTTGRRRTAVTHVNIFHDYPEKSGKFAANVVIV